MSSKFNIVSVIVVFLLFGFVYFTADRSTRFYINNTLLGEYNVRVQVYANGQLLLDENIKQNLITHWFSYSFKQNLKGENGISLEVVLPELNKSRKFELSREECDFVFITFSDILEPYIPEMIEAQGLSSESVKGRIPGI
ncbi:MAG: hypothetical protein ACJAS3_002590 [Roseivirga sp.]|jgi:hypothetical protein